MAERPKRRKHKDNPYTLQYCEKTKKYEVVFKDNNKGMQHIEVSSVIYQILDSFELEDERQRNEYRRHIEHSELFEESLHNRAMDKPIGIEEQVIQKTSFED